MRDRCVSQRTQPSHTQIRYASHSETTQRGARRKRKNAAAATQTIRRLLRSRSYTSAACLADALQLRLHWSRRKALFALLLTHSRGHTSSRTVSLSQRCCLRVARLGALRCADRGDALRSLHNAVRPGSQLSASLFPRPLCCGALRRVLRCTQRLAPPRLPPLFPRTHLGLACRSSSPVFVAAHLVLLNFTAQRHASSALSCPHRSPGDRDDRGTHTRRSTSR